MSTGQLQSLQQSASQYAGMVTAFCDKLRLDFILFQKLFFPVFAENSFSRYRHFGGLPRNTFLSAIEKYKNGLIQFLTKIFNPSRKKMKSFKVGSI